MKAIADIRLRIQCANVKDHAKILPMHNFLAVAPGDALDQNAAERELKMYFARRLGEIICGQSGMYVYQPGSQSPIGRCVLCGGALSFEIEERDNENKPRLPKKRSDAHSAAPISRRTSRSYHPTGGKAL